MTFPAVALIGVENCSYSFDNLFSYAVPEDYKEFISPGIRVMVPFGSGNKLRQGFVFDVSDKITDDVTLKSIASVIDSRPILSEEHIKLALWLQERCFCTYFSAAKALLPGGMCMKTERIYSCASDILPEDYNKLSGDERAVIDLLRKKRDFVRESLILKRIGVESSSVLLKKMTRKKLLLESSDAFSRVRDLSLQLVKLSDDFTRDTYDCITDKQKAVVDALFDIGAASVKELCYFTGVSESVVKTLIKNGVCVLFSAPVQREVDIDTDQFTYKKPVLSDMQSACFDELYKSYKTKSHRSALLFGVTGSGKTSVYLQLIDSVLADNKNVIVLVPEISLTPQTFSIFKQRYKDDIAVLHSGLSMGERHDEWKRIYEGKVRVVIGTRSAIFAPIDNIGLIVIDEEQEHTYKSEMSPRYNAKDVARFRCKYNDAFLLLASATPSVESYAKAKSGQMLLCELKSRFGNAVLPDVHTVDMTVRSNKTAFFSISAPLAEEIEKNLHNNEQSILLVNRRGFNTFVACSECKKVVTCPKCSISMTYHSANNRLMCHYCGYSIPFAVSCPSCGAENIRYSGFGTQRVEQELKIRFPDARVIRMDADTTANKNSHSKVLKAFASGEYDILIGTQMVAKGLDFPDVTLVGITSADKELYNNDFRCSERSFDLITQVVGRAGRGKKKGRAVIQTVSPDNNIIKIASKQDYKSFFNSEINLRKALIYPPFCDICEIFFSAASQEAVNLCARTFFERLVSLNENEYNDLKIIILGPMAPRVSKINEFYRQRILIKCKNSLRFREYIRIILKEISSDKGFRNVMISADINPENLN